jgi:hypothetical protein
MLVRSSDDEPASAAETQRHDSLKKQKQKQKQQAKKEKSKSGGNPITFDVSRRLQLTLGA